MGEQWTVNNNRKNNGNERKMNRKSSREMNEKTNNNFNQFVTISNLE